MCMIGYRGLRARAEVLVCDRSFQSSLSMLVGSELKHKCRWWEAVVGGADISSFWLLLHEDVQLLIMTLALRG